MSSIKVTFFKLQILEAFIMVFLQSKISQKWVQHEKCIFVFMGWNFNGE